MPDFSNKGLGRRPAPDTRDRKFLISKLLAEVPTYKHPSMWYRTGPVLDQGNTPTCVGYAWRQWMSSALVMTKGGPDALEIYSGAQKRDEWDGEDYDGTSVRGGAKYLQEKGHIANYYWALTVTEIKDFLLKGLGTIVLGTNWYESMFEVDKSTGLMVVGGGLAGGHGYNCIGYSNPRNAFRCMCNWGDEFAQGGRFWLAANDLARLLEEDGEACCATEKKV